MRTYGRPLACPGKCEACSRGTHIFKVYNPPFLLQVNLFPILVLNVTAVAVDLTVLPARTICATLSSGVSTSVTEAVICFGRPWAVTAANVLEPLCGM